MAEKRLGKQLYPKHLRGKLAHGGIASLFLSLESVFGVIFSVLLYGEVVTARLLVGFTLIFIAILVNELLAPRLEAKRAIVAFKRKKWKEDEGNV